MTVSAVVAFWGVALLLIIVPGADWAFVLDAGLRRAVLPAVGGLMVGYLALTVIVATGVGLVLATSPSTLTTVTIVGGTYLLWHGVMAFARPATSPATSDRTVAGGVGATSAHTLLRGIGVSGLNPKGLLIFLALLPQFTAPHTTWPIAAQIGVLGLTFVATCAIFYLALGVLADRTLTRRPGLARLVSRLSGVGMVVVGTALILERVVPLLG